MGYVNVPPCFLDFFPKAVTTRLRAEALPPLAAIAFRSPLLRDLARAGPPFLPPAAPSTFAAAVSPPDDLAMSDSLEDRMRFLC